MSRSKQPVFERPDEPQFLKRLRGVHDTEKQALERPMTDAPVAEDELPAVANSVDESDLVALRKMHGVEEPKEKGPGDASLPRVGTVASESRLAGLKTKNIQSQKRMRQLQELRAAQSREDNLEDDTEADETPRRQIKSKNKSGPRKKIKLAIHDDDA